MDILSTIHHSGSQGVRAPSPDHADISSSWIMARPKIAI